METMSYIWIILRQKIVEEQQLIALEKIEEEKEEYSYYIPYQGTRNL